MYLRNLSFVQGDGANQEYQIDKTSVGGPRIEDEGQKGAEGSSERIHRKERTGWKAQRKMNRRS